MWGGCLDVSAHLFGLALDSCRLILLHTVWQVIASSSAFKLACLHLIGWKAGICTWIISILPEGCQSVLVHFSPEFENTFMKGEDSQSTHRKWQATTIEDSLPTALQVICVIKNPTFRKEILTLLPTRNAKNPLTAWHHPKCPANQSNNSVPRFRHGIFFGNPSQSVCTEAVN